VSRNIKCYEAGSTVKFIWVSSGATPNPILSSIIDGSETMVSSETAVSSGNGHYYAYMGVPNTPGYYVNGWIAQISVNTYVSRQRFQVVRTEVD